MQDRIGLGNLKKTERTERSRGAEMVLSSLWDTGLVVIHGLQPRGKWLCHCCDFKNKISGICIYSLWCFIVVSCQQCEFYSKVQMVKITCTESVVFLLQILRTGFLMFTFCYIFHLLTKAPALLSDHLCKVLCQTCIKFFFTCCILIISFSLYINFWVLICRIK